MSVESKDCREDRAYCGLCKHWKNSQYLVGYCIVKGHNKMCFDNVCESVTTKEKVNVA